MRLCALSPASAAWHPCRSVGFPCTLWRPTGFWRKTGEVQDPEKKVEAYQVKSHLPIVMLHPSSRNGLQIAGGAAKLTVHLPTFER